MSRKRFSVEQIINHLREAEVLLGHVANHVTAKAEIAVRRARAKASTGSPRTSA